MNAPFIDFVRRFRQLERENAAPSASPPPETFALRPPAAQPEIPSPDGNPIAR